MNTSSLAADLDTVREGLTGARQHIAAIGSPTDEVDAAVRAFLDDALSALSRVESALASHAALAEEVRGLARQVRGVLRVCEDPANVTSDHRARTVDELGSLVRALLSPPIVDVESIAAKVASAQPVANAGPVAETVVDSGDGWQLRAGRHENGDVSIGALNTESRTGGGVVVRPAAFPALVRLMGGRL